MKKVIILLLLFLLSDAVYAFGVNAAAVNTIKYNQNRKYNSRQYSRNTMPYVYSPQQAKYYGINVANPNNQYRQYGVYQQNYSQNTNYTQRYGY